MKKFLKYFKFVFIIPILGIILQSCEPTESKPYCEEHHTCTVKVLNSTGYNIKVDVNYINEMWLSPGYTANYTKVPSGAVTIWASFNGSDWVYWDRSVSDCNTLNFTIYLSGKSSIPNDGKSEYLDMSTGKIGKR